MRQVSKLVSIIFLLSFGLNPTCAFVKGGVEYKIPIDYSTINQAEFETKADEYYQNAIQSNSDKITEDITQALNLYTALNNKISSNIIYPIRLGVLYDKINMDKFAKGNFYKAIGIDNTQAEPYFYFGEFYSKRKQFRKALKMYKKAKELGYKDTSTLSTRIDIINKKLNITNP